MAPGPDKAGALSARRGGVGTHTGIAADRARARARSLALPLLILVVPWQAWWRTGFLSHRREEHQPGLQADAPSAEVEEEQQEVAWDPAYGPALPPTPSEAGDPLEDGEERPGSGRAMTLPTGLQLAVFDLAGTTLNDAVGGVPLAVAAIRAAFARAGLEVSVQAVTALRGLEKREAIRRLCLQQQVSGSETKDADDEAKEELVAKIHGYFLEALNEGLRRFPLQEVPGASAAFQALRDRGIRVVVSSGFALDVVQEVVGRLGWQVDGLVAARRPRPDAVLEAMTMAGVQEPDHVLKVGDTVADVEEGRNAGVWTVAVLTGSQDEADLRAAGPDFVLRSVADLQSLLPPLDKGNIEGPSEAPEQPEQQPPRAPREADAPESPEELEAPVAPTAPEAPKATAAPVQLETRSDEE